MTPSQVCRCILGLRGTVPIPHSILERSIPREESFCVQLLFLSFLASSPSSSDGIVITMLGTTRPKAESLRTSISDSAVVSSRSGASPASDTGSLTATLFSSTSSELLLLLLRSSVETSTLLLLLLLLEVSSSIGEATTPLSTSEAGFSWAFSLASALADSWMEKILASPHGEVVIKRWNSMPFFSLKNSDAIGGSSHKNLPYVEISYMYLPSTGSG